MFYRDHPGRMAFFVVEGSGNHHDFAPAEVGAAAPAPDEAAVGLAQVAFKVGDHLDALRAARERLRRHGVWLLGRSDHAESQSLCLSAPNPCDALTRPSMAPLVGADLLPAARRCRTAPGAADVGLSRPRAG